MVVIFLVGFGFILYPIVANEWNEICRRKVITVYDRQVEQSVEQGKISYENEKRKADEYNKALRFNITDDGFVSNNDNSVNNSDNDTDEDNNKDNEESSFDENSEYNKCLNLNNDGMMGYISILFLRIFPENCNFIHFFVIYETVRDFCQMIPLRQILCSTIHLVI